MKIKQLNLKAIYLILKQSLQYHYAGLASWSIFGVLFFLSLLAGLQLSSKNELFLAGEVAQQDVVASKTLKVEDVQATQLRREQSMALQPMLYDLNKAAAIQFRETILTLLGEINNQGLDIDSLAKVQNAFNKRHNTSFERSFFGALANPDVQHYLTQTLIPFMEKLLLQGIFSDIGQLSSMQSAVLIRDPDLGTETLIMPSSESFNDLRSFRLRVGQLVRNSELSNSEKNVLISLTDTIAFPTLVFNRDATMQRTTSVSSAVAPIYYSIQKGEIIVSEGEMVTREQQVKMQALHKFSSRQMDFVHSLGVLILSFALAIGLFLTPTGKVGTKLQDEDQFFIASLLFFFGSIGAITSQMFFSTLSPAAVEIWAFSFPIAGIAGLSALIFSARRYCIIGLLFSLFICIYFKGGAALFIFYFLSAMVNTLLILKAQNRSDVVSSTLVLWLCQLILGLGAAAFIGVHYKDFLLMLLAISINTILSLFLIFALSPLVEMLFSLTTRFRLMELMNLEQPLLQELMMSTPGTYHHSLIVSNLVEAGAKSIGANNLLARVAALYHDIGKIVRPEYFVENQHDGINKHDTLAPAMSALILISHVKQGTELAEKYRLGKEITDIISQHHGNRCITYFYHKAQKVGDNPKESDYSYPSIRPQSKEAAIVMLADAIEASSRTLSDPTPARIQSHVDTIVKGIYSEGQLDESELTFKDLSKLAESFTRILTGLFHQRIVYPEKNKKQG